MRREARNTPEVNVAAEVSATMPVAFAEETRGSGVSTSISRGHGVIPVDSGLVQCNNLVKRRRIRVHTRNARNAVRGDAAQVCPQAAW